MNHSFQYQPWGDPFASGVSSILFAAWIGTANLFLIVLFITNPKLLNSRQNIVLLHNAVADLTVGVFYCPLAAEHFFRGFWAHGCSSFFVWVSFNIPLCFLTCHSILMILVLRIISLYFRVSMARWSRSVVNLIFSLTFVFLWSYLVVIGVYRSNSRTSDVHIEIAPQVSCRGVVANYRGTLIDLLVYFIPASLSVVLLVVVVVREKTTMAIPMPQLQLDTVTDQLNGLSLSALSGLTLLTSLLPLPTFLICSIIIGRNGCESDTCFLWLHALAIMADWVMLAKSGIVPLLLFTVGDFRSAIQGVLHSFRRLPTSDERDLMPQIEDANDDAPFCSM